MRTITVTGASGFLGGHCVRQALADGWRVRGTLRDPQLEAQAREAAGHLASDRLTLVEADLTSDDGWREAVRGSEVVLHVASPFPRSQPEDADAVVRPAVDGTRRVMAAAAAGGVRRVVVTSSMNACAGSGGHPEGYRLTDEDWADPDDPALSPYDLSKTLAEREAWRLSRKPGSPEVVTVLPGAILGPVLTDDLSASADIVSKLLTGAVPAIPRVGFAPVDVRDAADAHLTAADATGAAGRRFLCCLDHVWLEEVAAILRRRYAEDGYDVPARRMPDLAVRVGALVSPTLRRTAHALGQRRLVDTGPARDILGWKPRGVEAMVTAMADSLIERGLARPR